MEGAVKMSESKKMQLGRPRGNDTCMHLWRHHKEHMLHAAAICEQPKASSMAPRRAPARKHNSSASC